MTPHELNVMTAAYRCVDALSQRWLTVDCTRAEEKAIRELNDALQSLPPDAKQELDAALKISTLWDVVEVHINTGTVTRVLNTTGMIERDAVAYRDIAVSRRGVLEHIYAAVPQGRYREGDLYGT